MSYMDERQVISTEAGSKYAPGVLRLAPVTLGAMAVHASPDFHSISIDSKWNALYWLRCGAR